MYDQRDGEQAESLTLSKNAAMMHAVEYVDAAEKKAVRQVLLLQIIAVLLAAAVVYCTNNNPVVAIAALLGGGVSVVNGVLIAWRMKRLSIQPVYAAQHQLKLLYFYAAERNLVVIMLLCLGMFVIKLRPLGLMGGFALGQMVLMMGRPLLRRLKTKIETKDVQ